MGTALGFDEEIEQNTPDMIFTDRDEPRKIFWEAYEKVNHSSFYVINYYGFGGIGKSWLCKHLHGLLKAQEHPYTGQKIKSKSLILNFEELKDSCDKVNVLKHLANRFESECGFKFPIFKYALYVYYRTQGFSNSSPEIKKIQDNKIVDIALEFLGMVPAVGSIGTYVLKKADSFAAELQDYLRKNSATITKLDNMSTEDIASELVTIFGRELYACTQKEKYPVVLFLDTYEQLQNYVYQVSSAKISEEWLWARTGLIRRIPNVLWVLAGQRQVNWKQEDSFWSDEENIHYEEIGEINERETLVKLLQELKITEPEIIETIIDKTRGVPVHLALCKDTYYNLKLEHKQPQAADFDMDYAKLAKRFIGGLNALLKDIVDVLSCLESWTMKDLSAFDMSADAYEYIMQLSFINYNEGFYYMHNSVQEIVYRNCSALIVDKCLRYFTRMAEDSSVTKTERQNYIYKKAKLQLKKIADIQDAEKRKEQYGEFLKENLPYLRENIQDYNFFEKMKKLIRQEIPEDYQFFPYTKTLNIYSMYHSATTNEHAVLRHWIQNTDITEGHLRLPEDTRAFLYMALAAYAEVLAEYKKARSYYHEAYYLWKESAEESMQLKALQKLALCCISLKDDQGAMNYCNEGLLRLRNLRMDTELVVLYNNFLYCKARIERSCSHTGEVLKILKEAEENLSGFATVDSDSIYRSYGVLYYEYKKIYHFMGNEAKTVAFAQKCLVYAQKAYEAAASNINRRNLAVSYQDYGACVHGEEQIENYNKAIQIYEDLFRIQQTDISYTEWFRALKNVVGKVWGKEKQAYLEQCEEMLRSPDAHRINWKELFNYHVTRILDDIQRKCCREAEQKLEEMERLVEQRKSRLSEEEYLDYKAWNLYYRGLVMQQEDKPYEVIACYKKMVAIHYELYTGYPAYAAGEEYANACLKLSEVYRQRKMYSYAIRYAKEAIEIRKKTMEEFECFSAIIKYVESIRYLLGNYMDMREGDKVCALCEEALRWCHKINAQEIILTNLSRMLVFYAKLESFQLNKENARMFKQAYENLLEAYRKLDVEEESEKNQQIIRDDIDLLYCKIASCSCILEENLEEARTLLLSAGCVYIDFTKKDREFFLTIIEKKILSSQVNHIHLTREEGIALLSEGN